MCLSFFRNERQFLILATQTQSSEAHDNNAFSLECDRSPRSGLIRAGGLSNVYCCVAVILQWVAEIPNNFLLPNYY